jgi:hypothetical protein
MSQRKQGLDFNLVMANTKTTKLIDNKNQIVMFSFMTHAAIDDSSFDNQIRSKVVSLCPIRIYKNFKSTTNVHNGNRGSLK